LASDHSALSPVSALGAESASFATAAAAFLACLECDDLVGASRHVPALQAFAPSPLTGTDSTMMMGGSGSGGGAWQPALFFHARSCLARWALATGEFRAAEAEAESLLAWTQRCGGNAVAWRVSALTLLADIGAEQQQQQHANAGSPCALHLSRVLAALELAESAGMHEQTAALAVRVATLHRTLDAPRAGVALLRRWLPYVFDQAALLLKIQLALELVRCLVAADPHMLDQAAAAGTDGKKHQTDAGLVECRSLLAHAARWNARLGNARLERDLCYWHARVAHALGRHAQRDAAAARFAQCERVVNASV
jgi:hypothetical protein